MANEMKILESESSSELTTKLNKHLETDWKIAGNSYNAVGKSPGKIVYSIMVMRYVPELDPRPAPPATTVVGTSEAWELNKQAMDEYAEVLEGWEERQRKGSD